MKFHSCIPRSLLSFAAAVFVSLPLHGTVLLNYDSAAQLGGNVNQPSVVQDNVELGGGFGDDQQTRITLADNSSDPWSSTAADYTGPAYSLVWDGIAYNEAATWDSRDSNPLSIRVQTNSTDIGGVIGKNGSGNFHLAVFFPYAGSASFDATSSLTVDFARLESTGTVRWLLRNGSTYYLSQSTITGDVTFDQGSGLLTENWAVYDIASGADFDQDNAVFSTPTSSLTDITAFGFMADKDTMTATRHWLELRGFTVDAVVPEPSTCGLLLGMGAFLILLIRRKRH